MSEIKQKISLKEQQEIAGILIQQIGNNNFQLENYRNQIKKIEDSLSLEEAHLLAYQYEDSQYDLSSIQAKMRKFRKMIENLKNEMDFLLNYNSRLGEQLCHVVTIVKINFKDLGIPKQNLTKIENMFSTYACLETGDIFVLEDVLSNVTELNTYEEWERISKIYRESHDVPTIEINQPVITLKKPIQK